MPNHITRSDTSPTCCIALREKDIDRLTVKGERPTRKFPSDVHPLHMTA